MRETEAGFWIDRNVLGALGRALRLGVVALGIGAVMTAGAARAADDDDDDRSVEQKIIGGIIAGVGGTNMDNRGIDYRERSPLVVPPRLDLPPPAASSNTVKAANWPKDPDETRRKKAIAERKKTNQNPFEAARTLSPEELNMARTPAAARTNGDDIPGNPLNQPATLSPEKLGFTGSLGGLLRGNAPESAPFKGEPPRDSLTQPPVGYQTPSPNFAYGTGAAAVPDKVYDPVAGKYH